MTSFDYDKVLGICLELLKEDFDNTEAHMVLLEVFHTLGFKNELVSDTKKSLKEIMMNSMMTQ